MSKTRKDFSTDEDYKKFRENKNKKERERRSKIRPEINRREKERRGKIRPQINKTERERRAKLKTDALFAYSEGDAHCLHCGEQNSEFLTLDHISGRESMGHAKHVKGHTLYSLLKREGYPPGMQILCWNWNEIKGKKDMWKKSPKSKRGKYAKEYSLKIKREVLTHYCSGKKPHCVCCGYDELEGLTVDHKEGRKVVPEDEAKYTGHKLRLILKKKNYPINYQVLCSNCNSAKSNNPQCPHERIRLEETFDRMTTQSSFEL